MGDDIGGFPGRVGGARAEADGPVAFSGAGHADDVEFDVAAERMAVERTRHPPLDLIEGCRRLGEKLEVHIAPSSVAVSPAVAADHPLGLLLGRFWLMAG